MATLTPASSPDMIITIKIVFVNKDENRRFKLPLKELGANSLPGKVRLTVPSAASHQQGLSMASKDLYFACENSRSVYIMLIYEFHLASLLTQHLIKSEHCL